MSVVSLIVLGLVSTLAQPAYLFDGTTSNEFTTETYGGFREFIMPKKSIHKISLKKLKTVEKTAKDFFPLR